MPKLVCDFKAVKNAGEAILEEAENMKTESQTYQSTIEGNVANWDGAAKSSFQALNKSYVSNAQNVANYTKAYGDFIKMAAEEIRKLDEELSNIKI